ncbi:sulfurtransferase TusA family protein [Texcoconibacillus texcoconensis]|uniref:tRNA 2-thiouridine synthesizing protein A n=1 Tax=Texcoconibacillus texcoconensis TaxID=1095777 RepID=A0A840QPM2_9BACI|nr:tRNA 2-thiouridine synthesizing protein A [Texcoconibacillus texcoconensis]
MIEIQGQVKIDFVYDAGSASCGELIMNIYLKMKQLEVGQVMEVISYDLSAVEDVPSWCRMQGHTLLHSEQGGLLQTHFFIQKEMK